MFHECPYKGGGRPQTGADPTPNERNARSATGAEQKNGENFCHGQTTATPAEEIEAKTAGEKLRPPPPLREATIAFVGVGVSPKTERRLNRTAWPSERLVRKSESPRAR